jgi:hypothetical protein
MEDTFTPNISPMGYPSLKYIDPEVLKYSNKMVFQDDKQRLWLAGIDPATGRLSSIIGHDILLDTDIAPIPSSRNGPEWALDAHGTSVIYNKADIQGTLQMWRARITKSGTVLTAQLTHGIQPSRGFRPSFIPTTDKTYIFYMLGTASNFETVWSISSDADTSYPVNDYYFPSAGARFIAGPDPTVPLLLHIHQDPSKLDTQIALLDTATGQLTILTNDSGEKFEPRAFNAPEFGGEMLIAALIDRQTLAIYRDLGDPDGFWTRIEELRLPDGEVNNVLYSVKPVDGPPGQDGINGITYFSLVANQYDSASDPGDTSMWLLGLGTDPNGRICRRVDEGAITGAVGFRYEPETYPSNSSLFFYYNVANPSDRELGQLRVVDTGISVSQ